MSSKRDVTVKALSSNLLQMKFMKKTVLGDPEKEDDEIYEEDAEHWVLDPALMKRHRHELNIQPSHSMCEDLAYGRMSFKGFNPAVEKIMRAMNGEEETEAGEVTEEDKQFAEQYAAVTNMADKFKTKRERAGNKREESKPYHKAGGKSERFKQKPRKGNT